MGQRKLWNKVSIASWVFTNHNYLLQFPESKRDHTNEDCLVIIFLTHGLDGGKLYCSCKV